MRVRPSVVVVLNWVAIGIKETYSAFLDSIFKRLALTGESGAQLWPGECKMPGDSILQSSNIKRTVAKEDAIMYAY